MTFVHCGQTVGWIKTKLGVQVGLDPRHIVLGDPAASPPKGHSPPIFGPYLLGPNGCMDQDATWYEGRPRPRRLCIRQGPRSTPQKKGGAAPPKFSAHVYCGQTAGWIKMVLGMELGDFVLDGDPVPLPKKGADRPKKFSAHVYCGQTAR